MSHLNKNEQIYIENVDQLINVYRLLKNKWDKNYSLINEITDFQRDNLTYVRWQGQGYPICLGRENPNYITITYDDFMSRVNPNYITITYDDFMSRVNPKSETTIIEAKDGKKYKVIVVEEVVEPLSFSKWYKKNKEKLRFVDSFSFENRDDSYVEEYIQYRKSLEQ
jgi:hypothetical protein